MRHAPGPSLCYYVSIRKARLVAGAFASEYGAAYLGVGKYGFTIKAPRNRPDVTRIDIDFNQLLPDGAFAWFGS